MTEIKGAAVEWRGRDVKMEDSSSLLSVCGEGRAGEKIFVSVRLRPLSKEREKGKEDETKSDWECINEKTIIFKQTIPERSMFPTAYSFDRVFGSEASTDEVYEEGVKQVALSALSGLNATIFAYGQTGSGKTYTMNGITDRSVADIYSYIERHWERVFVLKLSAMEIYNEVVKDLLSPEDTPLRLLDDPERGTVVEKLVEERVEDKWHLQKLLGLCDANRHVGETMLNETSSRSHQIIKLTIESCVREGSEKESESCLVASLNFVDLAGSERASQAFSAGSRLKEGCHINRSLLTLGTVIRKLSGSNKMRNGHIPYRDSKLTRILQHALGGNARTAIICTMSPARSYVEQSRNTLFFASCANVVATSAYVNVVMSDKALVKHLQKEVARLEDELRISGNSPSFHSTEALLLEKDLQIQKIEQEIKELTQQRNYAQSQLEDLLQQIESDQPSNRWRMDSYRQDESPALEPSGMVHELVSSELHYPIPQIYCNGEGKQATSENRPWKRPEVEAFLEMDEVQQSSASTQAQQSSDSTPKKQLVKESTLTPQILVHEIRNLEYLQEGNLEYLQEELGNDATRTLEALQREVRCLHLAQSGTNMDAASSMTELRGEIKALLSKEENSKPPEQITLRSADTILKEDISRLNGSGDISRLTDTDATIAAIEQQLQTVQESLENFVLTIPTEGIASPLSRTPSNMNKAPQLTGSRSCRVQFISSDLSSPCSWAIDAFEHNENTPPCASEKPCLERSRSLRKTLFHKNEEKAASFHGPPMHGTDSFVDIKEVQNMFKTAAHENISSIRSYVTELKERVAKL